MRSSHVEVYLNQLGRNKALSCLRVLQDLRNLFAAFSSILDVYTDVELLMAIFNKSKDCLDLSWESEGCLHHSYMKLGILLALSIAAPFVISYSHIIANLPLVYGWV